MNVLSPNEKKKKNVFMDFCPQAKDPDSDTVLDFSIVAGNDEKLFYMNNIT